MAIAAKDIDRLGPAARKQIRNADRNRHEVKTPVKKYHNTPCDYTMPDGAVKHFDSRKERDRFAELMLLRRAGEICGLELQKEFVLIPANKRDDGTTERACKYIADFVYRDPQTGKMTVEDTKGVRTKDYIIKRKLMLDIYGITVKEI